MSICLILSKRSVHHWAMRCSCIRRAVPYLECFWKHLTVGRMGSRIDHILRTIDLLHHFVVLRVFVGASIVIVQVLCLDEDGATCLLSRRARLFTALF